MEMQEGRQKKLRVKNFHFFSVGIYFCFLMC